ncbi:MAG: alpha/beta hydrolase [Polyangiales bacterium]
MDTGPIDSGMGTPSDDPVAYSGTFTVRTGRFTRNLNVAGQSRQVVLNVPTSAPASPALIVLFHGTNGDGSVAMTESNAVPLSNAEGVIVAAPTSRWIGHGDFDHATEETYWETETDPDPNHNPDVLLVRAILVEARRVYNVDPERVYLMGHSSGGFFAQFAATLLRDRVAAFAENSAGLVRCARRASCSFQGNGTTCATLATRGGWCGCSGAELPIAVATDGRMPPGYLSHGTSDPLVSVYYTCTLESRLRAVGADVTTELFNGEGHAVPTNWAQRVWPFFSGRTLSGR